MKTSRMRFVIAIAAFDSRLPVARMTQGILEAPHLRSNGVAAIKCSWTRNADGQSMTEWILLAKKKKRKTMR